MAESSHINPIVVRDCGDEIWSDTWVLDLDGETIAYVHGEDFAGWLAKLFDPTNDRFDLLDSMIYLMRTGLALAMDFEKLRREVEHPEAAGG